MNSIQVKLSIGLFISLVLAFSYLWQSTNDSISALSKQYVVQHLKHDAESILNALSVDDKNKLSLNLKQIEPVYLRPFSGQYYLIKTKNKLIRSRSLWDQTLLIPDLIAGEQKIFSLIGPEKQPLLIIASGFNKQGMTYTIAVAEDITPTLIGQQNFQYKYSYTVGGLLVFLLACQALILRLSFRPFKHIQRQIKQLRQGELQQINLQVPDEVLDLVGEINHLLKVMENRLERSRNALGDLAHALKIPLTVIQQLTNSPILKAQPEICDSLQKQTNNIQGVIQRVLKQARFSGEGVVIAKFNAREEVPELIQVLQSMYREKGISIQYTQTGKDVIAIDREDMMELLGNLLDNACKWAKSKITISIDNHESVQIMIEDDGPGISKENRVKLIKRGIRLDEMNEGHGLGLSIVQYMVEQYEGQLKLDHSNQLGGLLVKVTL